jgi:hypothetical protein
MPIKPNLTITQQIYEAKLKIFDAYEEYVTALYFETMPAFSCKVK